jgi:hypothetical protein
MSSSLVTDSDINHGNSYETTSKEICQKSLATQLYDMIVSFVKGLMPSNSSHISSSTWILDSGTSHHVSSDRESFLFINPTSPKRAKTTQLSNDTIMYSTGTGIGSISTSNLSLSNVYYIPNIAWNIV